MRTLVIAAAFCGFAGTAAGGPFKKPMSAAPQVTKADREVEGQRQLDFTLDSRVAEISRVDAVASKLLRANADLCPKTRARLGIKTATAAQFKGPLKDAAQRRWGLAESVRVIAVTPDGAGALAGVQTGDEIVAIEGQPVASGKKAFERWDKQASEIMEKSPTSVRLTVSRAGESHDLALTPVRECAYDVVLDEDDPSLNAFADGKKIGLTRPILKLAANDSELALVLAHELAHNARGHINAKKQNQAVGMLGGASLDILAAVAGVNTEGAFTKAGAQIGAGVYSPEFESEADYVGLYYVARGGFSTEGVETFWRRMAAEDPGGILVRSSHPPSADRYLAIAAARSEISEKSVGSASLVPTERSK